MDYNLKNEYKFFFYKYDKKYIKFGSEFYRRICEYRYKINVMKHINYIIDWFYNIKLNNQTLYFYTDTFVRIDSNNQIDAWYKFGRKQGKFCLVEQYKPPTGMVVRDFEQIDVYHME